MWHDVLVNLVNEWGFRNTFFYKCFLFRGSTWLEGQCLTNITAYLDSNDTLHTRKEVMTGITTWYSRNCSSKFKNLIVSCLFLKEVNEVGVNIRTHPDHSIIRLRLTTTKLKSERRETYRRNQNQFF